MTKSDDKTPRYRPNRLSRALLLWHPCSVCGDINAPFGYGVAVLKGKMGAWFCGECNGARDG